MATHVKLQSNDGETYEVEFAVAKKSETIKNILEDLPDADDDEPVPLPNVNSQILRKVIAWCTQHRDDPPVPEDDNIDAREKRTDNIDSWDQEFLQVDQGTLFELILASNYLHIKVIRLCIFVFHGFSLFLSLLRHEYENISENKQRAQVIVYRACLFYWLSQLFDDILHYFVWYSGGLHSRLCEEACYLSVIPCEISKYEIRNLRTVLFRPLWTHQRSTEEWGRAW